MAKVPYNPEPSVGSSSTATPKISHQLPSEAFGTGISKAFEGLAAQIGRSSDELFTRALAMQNLANESEAREAESLYTIEVGKLHAEYNSLEGKAAVDAFPQYQQNLNDLRQKIGAGLSNPASRRMFDASARGTMSRTIFNGASHAAGQNRRWAVSTIDSQIQLAAKTVEDDPENDLLFREKIANVEHWVGQLAALRGYEPGSPQEQQMSLELTSKLWSQRLIGMSREQPFEAAKLLDETKTALTQADFLRVDSAVRNQARAVGSVNIANEVYDPAKSMQEMEEEARGRAEKLNPKDPILGQNSVAAVRSLVNQRRAAERDERLTNREVVAAGIQQGVRDIRELRKDPRVAKAIDALPATEQNAIPGQINRFNSARDRQTQIDAYWELRGLMQNDPLKFLETDVTKLPLSQSDMRQAMKWQEQMKANPRQDLRVQRAITWLRGGMASQLTALGIYSRNADNAADYDNFTGALQSALDVYQEDHGKPADYQTVVNEIGPRIIQQRSVPGALFGSWWTSNRPFFDQDVPDDFTDRFKADVMSRGGVEPTDEQVYSAYVRAKYFELYGSKKDKSRVPQR